MSKKLLIANNVQEEISEDKKITLYSGYIDNNGDLTDFSTYYFRSDYINVENSNYITVKIQGEATLSTYCTYNSSKKKLVYYGSLSGKEKTIKIGSAAYIAFDFEKSSPSLDVNSLKATYILE